MLIPGKESKMKELKLEVGKTYINRQGDKVKILRKETTSNGPIYFEDDCKYHYFKDGKHYGLETAYDLVKEVTEDKHKSKTKLYRSGPSTLAVTSVDNVVTLRDSTGSLGYSTDENEVDAILTDTQNGYICKFPSFNSVSQDYYVCLDYAQAEYLYLVLKEALGKNVKRVKE